MNQQKNPESGRRWIRRKPETMLDWMVIIFASIAFYMVLNKGGFVLDTLSGLAGILAPFAGGVVVSPQADSRSAARSRVDRTPFFSFLNFDINTSHSVYWSFIFTILFYHRWTSYVNL